VSTDRVIKAPYLTQWLGKPYYMAMPVVTTAAAGLVFVAAGHTAHHDREVPTMYTLTARNGYNGEVLWTRKLPEGYMVHRSAFVAEEDSFYLMMGGEFLRLNPETGEELERIAIPGVGGHWVWMTKVGDVLYALSAGERVPVETTLVRSRGDHWGWGSISAGYRLNERVPWGHGETLAAYDIAEKKVLWKHVEPKPIDSRGVGILGDRMFFYTPESRLACVDVSSGKVLWQNTDTEKLSLLEVAGVGLSSTPGFKSECMMLCTPDALVMQAQTRANVLAFSPDDGRFLWSATKSRNNPNTLYVNGTLVISGIGQPNRTREVDAGTGELLRDLAFSKVSCTRMTACPDALFCRGEGLGRYDLAEGRYYTDKSARPGCHDGAIPANGLLYVGPWLCDCNLALVGTMTLGPAGDFEVGQAADQKERLQLGEGNISKVAPCEVGEGDWPTYRGNNDRSGGSPVAVAAKYEAAWAYKTDTGANLSSPTTAGELAFFGAEDGIVRCLDMGTGEEQWQFVTAGPVRLPPSIWESRAYVGSADGYVYCLEAATGRMLWRFRAAPVERRIMVYGSLSSTWPVNSGVTWPVNSGVLVADGVAYAAAGIIDRDGTHVYALDAKTGKLIWQNNESGHVNEQTRQGVSALGGLVIAKGKLWLAGGNMLPPAGFDLQTGEYQADTEVPKWGKPPEPRGCEISVFDGRYLIHGGRLLYSGEGNIVSSAQFSVRELLDDGSFGAVDVIPLDRSGIPPAWDGEVFACLSQRYNQLLCWERAEVEGHLQAANDELGRIQEENSDPKVDYRQRRDAIRQGTMSFERELRKTGRWGTKQHDTVGLVVTRNAIVCLAELKQPEADSIWWLAAYDKATGKPVFAQKLPDAPRLNGLAVGREGRILVALRGGGLVCYGAAAVSG